MHSVTRREFVLGLAALSVVAALPARAATNHAVTIQGMKFNPADLAIKVGDSVTFTNMDAAPHTASADGGAFDSGQLSKGQAATVTFNGKGEFAYHCNIHRGMKAIIHVS
ncbi:MAG: cupredoxin family copper-binding protein [bacterium]